MPTRVVVEPIEFGSVRPRRPSWILPIGIVFGALVLAVAVLAPRVTLPWEPPATVPTEIAQIVPSPTVAPPAVAPPPTTTGPPTVTPIAAGASSPTPVLRIATSGRTARITAPTDGDRVGESVIVRGTLDGPLSANEHLWLVLRPRLGPDNWWAVEQEIRPAPSGAWESTAYFGGEAGLFHRLAVGIADADGHRAITQHLRAQPGQPFERGLPTGFTRLDEISVEKNVP